MAGAALRLTQEVEEPRSTFADEARAAEAVAFIAQNLAAPLSVADMAATVGLGRYHFIRLFRRVVGTTPYQFLIIQRLAGAADALREGSDVLDAALGNGFTDLSEFTRRFGAKFGQTPGAYRRAHNPRRRGYRIHLAEFSALVSQPVGCETAGNRAFSQGCEYHRRASEPPASGKL